MHMSFLTLWTGYICAAALFRTAGVNLPIAIALSVVAMTHPFARQEIFQGRPTQVHWLFHCVFLIATLQLLKSKFSWKWSLIGGVALAGACLVYWFGGAAVGFAAAFAALVGTLLSRFFTRRLAALESIGDDSHRHHPIVNLANLI